MAMAADATGGSAPMRGNRPWVGSRDAAQAARDGRRASWQSRGWGTAGEISAATGLARAPAASTLGELVSNGRLLSAASFPPAAWDSIETGEATEAANVSAVSRTMGTATQAAQSASSSTDRVAPGTYHSRRQPPA